MSNQYEDLVSAAQLAADTAMQIAEEVAADRLAVETLYNEINLIKIPSLNASKESIRQAIINKRTKL